MNEFVAAKPTAWESSFELKLLLSYFGPYTGRYLATYPNSWKEELLKHAEALHPLEAERVKLLLRRAIENTAIVSNPSLKWNPAETWEKNFITLMGEQKSRFAFGITNQSFPAEGLLSINDIDFPPTADEQIEATANEFTRVSRTLLLSSHELIFIDPYMNPFRKDVRTVLTAMLDIAAKGKCREVTCWAREAEITGQRRGNSLDEIANALMQASQKFAQEGRVLKFRLIDDVTTKKRLHARYLLSQKGAIRFDQGFQELTKGKKIDVSPVGRSVHDNLITQFFEDQKEFKIINEIVVKQSKYRII